MMAAAHHVLLCGVLYYGTESRLQDKSMWWTEKKPKKED